MEKQKGFLWIPDKAGEELVEWYRASDVDARIAELRKAFETSSTDEENKLRARVAELEKILRLCFFNLYPAGTTFEDAYAQALKASNALMGG